MPRGSHDLTQTDLVFCLDNTLHSTPFLAALDMGQQAIDPAGLPNPERN
jgi:hypothetical protein